MILTSVLPSNSFSTSCYSIKTMETGHFFFNNYVLNCHKCASHKSTISASSILPKLYNYSDKFLWEIGVLHTDSISCPVSFYDLGVMQPWEGRGSGASDASWGTDGLRADWCDLRALEGFLGFSFFRFESESLEECWSGGMCSTWILAIINTGNLQFILFDT